MNNDSTIIEAKQNVSYTRESEAKLNAENIGTMKLLLLCDDIYIANTCDATIVGG